MRRLLYITSALDSFSDIATAAAYPPKNKVTYSNVTVVYISVLIYNLRIVIYHNPVQEKDISLL